MNSRATLAAALLCALALNGCSKIVPKLDEVVPDNRKDYQKARSLPDLEVPPDLSTEAIQDRMAIPDGGETARYSTFQERRADRQRAADLEKAQTSAIRVLENEHVLAVEGAAVQVWPRLEAFWQAQGYDLELDDVELGIIETGWNEDKAELTRDKFKVFAEAGEQPGTTLLYISHEGQELAPQGEELVWSRRPRNVELERAMVERLEAELGGAAVASAPSAPSVAASTDEAPAAAAATPAATVDDGSIGAPVPATGEPRHAEIVSVGDGKYYLTLADGFSGAWKATGRALEQVGVAVKDSDKGRGIYYVEVATAGGQGDDGGVWGKLKFWDKGDAAEYQVSLTGVGEKTEVVVLDRDGRWETGDDASALLNKLQDALNSGRI
ncbi:MAG: outer membrane protein assembly factor BamC [Gammaproteobacteria bacterium]|nr:outer membrane protein assembly factor BamC [Gammaproteobacteria bacterium]MCP5200711.1 outer membrane protein assembly factor BamC [Gammaproteobacteria bacterium]